MTPVESGLTFWAVIGLAGCAAALVALVRDWRETQPRAYTLDFGDLPLADRPFHAHLETPPAPTSWTTTNQPGWQVGETKPVADSSLPKAGA